jgi:hypothetical protein
VLIESPLFIAGKLPWSFGSGESMTPIRDKDDLATALSQPLAFLFLWVDWAIHARHSRVVVDKVITAWHSEHPLQPGPYYIADVSEQCGDVWDSLAEWLAADGCPAGNLLMSGAGPLLVIRSGHVVFHVLTPLNYDAEKLMAMCRNALAADAESSPDGVA